MSTTRAPLDVAIGLYDHYESIAEVKAYYGVLAIYALARAADVGGDPGLWDRVERVLRRFPDGVDHPPYNFPSYRIGGIAQAYALLRGRTGDRADLVREYAEEMMTAPRDAAGIVVRPRTAELQQIWIDAAMPTTPYLLFAGLRFGERSYIDEAVHQSVAMYEALLDPANGLLHQSRNIAGPGRLSQDHWGRGNGWGFIGLTTLVEYLPVEHPQRERVLDLFQAHAAAMLPYQSERGLWRQEIPEQLSYEESSGTGLILNGYGVGLRTGVLDEGTYGAAFRRGVAGLAAVAINADLSTELSCPSCLSPGRGEGKGSVQAYVTLRLPHRDEPHSFGPLMLALAEAHMLGVRQVAVADAELRW